MRPIRDIFRDYAVIVDGRHTNGTDKESNHRYGDAYEKIVPARTSVKLMLEVGVADGSSLLAWREVFPNATIVGMDIHHSDKAHGERIEFHIGDQRSYLDCKNAAKDRLFDMIVEDATHRLDNTLLTLFYLWPHVRPGGVYVVEEWDNIGQFYGNIRALFPAAEIVNTIGPFGGIEPLVVLRKQ